MLRASQENLKLVCKRLGRDKRSRLIGLFLSHEGKVQPYLSAFQVLHSRVGSRPHKQRLDKTNQASQGQTL
jgi:hypothetical protein